jgi:hypothetical protein
MKYNIVIWIMGLLFLGISSCKTSSYARFNFKTECIGSELDGSNTLKAWGKGRYYKDAVDQAKKNAINDVIFMGIQDAQGGCNMKPLVFEVNAREKYEKYFNTFFEDGGEYTNYVTLQDEKIENNAIRVAKYRDKGSSVYSVVLRVLRDDIKKKLIKDGILKL